MDLLLGLGRGVVHVVLFVAGLVKSEASPGLVALALVIALVILAFVFSIKGARKIRAIKWVLKEIRQNSKGEKFGSDITEITRAIHASANDDPKKHLESAWVNYRGTFIIEDKKDTNDSLDIIVHGVTRPSTFFNTEDLGFGLGAWRIVPGLFVSIGLFFTFLGLVAALSTMGQSSEITSSVMSQLLSIAAAKFIMSLTGLLCSIIFTIWMRRLYSRLEYLLHNLCREIEKRVSYINLEDIAIKQLNATVAQKDHFKTIGLELVAKLERPLVELPDKMKESVNSAIEPVMEKVSQMGTQGVGDMVSGLSAQLTNSVTAALQEASVRIADAGDKLGQVADRLEQSSGNIGSNMEGIVERVVKGVDELKLALSSFKQQIQTVTADEATAAGEKMQAVGHQVSGYIGDAGKVVADRVSSISNEIAQTVGNLAEKAGKDLVAPLADVGTSLQSLIGQINNSTNNMALMSEGVKAGADASSRAAVTFNGTVETLVEAVTPVRNIVDGMGTSIQKLNESTNHVATSVVNSTRAAGQALETAKTILSDERSAVNAALSGVSEMLERMKRQGDRLDTMDEKLGTAFEQYASQVEQAINTISEHVNELQTRLQPALETMREVVEQAETFMPQQTRS